MGCNISKLDRLPAVSLCRDRSKFIDETLRQSYHLADAHVAHMESLRTLGPALFRFFEQCEDSGITNGINPTSTPLSSLSSSSSDSEAARVSLHSESETDHEGELQLCTHSYRRCDYLHHHDTVLSSVSDSVSFMTYAKPIYDSYSPHNTVVFKPPSPPPPSNSAWDFLNFFEPYEKYQVPYCESEDCFTDNKIRIEKEKEKVNVNGDKTQKNECLKSNRGGGKVSKVENREEKNKETDLKVESSVLEKDSPEFVKVETAEAFSEAVKEIQILFERESDSGKTILEMLDVGKLRYHSKVEVNTVSWKVMHVFSQPNPVRNKCLEGSLLGRKAGSDFKGVCEDKSLSHGNLCSSLSKLCLWEKKLYHEVKAEEKMRTLHEKKCNQLKHMIKKEADAKKIDSVKAFIDILVTNMRISIQVVDKISITISKLTEEVLWPQINMFILMFLRMWKDMQQCYKFQYQKIVETKALDVSTFNIKPCNASTEAAIQLKSELQKWILSFLDWIQAQKSLVKALSDWLVRCLMYEPKEILDDSAPFDAPHVFVICNKWSKAMDNISEKNVIEAVNGFIVRVNEPLEKYILEHQKNSSLEKELERKVKIVERQGQKMKRKVKIMERQEQKMHKLVVPREKKMAQIAKELQQSGLKEIFVAMEKFSATNVSLYEELCQ